MHRYLVTGEYSDLTSYTKRFWWHWCSLVSGTTFSVSVRPTIILIYTQQQLITTHRFINCKHRRLGVRFGINAFSYHIGPTCSVYNISLFSPAGSYVTNLSYLIYIFFYGRYRRYPLLCCVAWKIGDRCSCHQCHVHHVDIPQQVI